MATNIAPMSNEAVSVGRIMNRSFAAIGANPLVMLSIAFLFGALPSVIIAYFNQRLQISLVGQPNGVRDSAILTMGSAIIGLVLSMIVQGALVRATMAHSEGRRASFGESVVAGLRVVLPLIGLSLIVGFSIGFGLLLLIVPGVILYLIWSVAAPVLVEERSGVFGALGRSRSLTKGARWKIFGLELIILLFYWLTSALLGFAIGITNGGLQAMAQMTQTGLPITWLIGNAVIATLINTFWSTAQTSLYVELRDWKDGPRGRQLEEVFA
ncbi:hypothetical protein [Sphingomonas sp. ERG5]|uniref:hypothetical protein n=1 Tax=Sphingomonas sp. ERG5 TaxID=1381597 RepID=UPI00068B2B2B|nr:hypothetical protein [Sphingomonas sp. ERG5]